MNALSPTNSAFPRLSGFDPEAIAALQNAPRSADVAETGELRRQRDFAEVMSIASRRIDGGGAETKAEQSRDAAERFIAVALVQPILDQARESSDAAPPFQPTRGEKQFRSLIDAQTAINIVRSSRLPIVDRLADSLLQHAQAEADAKAQLSGGPNS